MKIQATRTLNFKQIYRQNYNSDLSDEQRNFMDEMSKILKKKENFSSKNLLKKLEDKGWDIYTASDSKNDNIMNVALLKNAEEGASIVMNDSGTNSIVTTLNYDKFIILGGFFATNNTQNIQKESCSYSIFSADKLIERIKLALKKDSLKIFNKKINTLA